MQTRMIKRPSKKKNPVMLSYFHLLFFAFEPFIILFL